MSIVTAAVTRPPAGTSEAPGRMDVHVDKSFGVCPSLPHEGTRRDGRGGGVQDDVRVRRCGVGDLDPAVDRRARGEVIHDVDPRSGIVSALAGASTSRSPMLPTLPADQAGALVVDAPAAAAMTAVKSRAAAEEGAHVLAYTTEWVIVAE